MGDSDPLAELAKSNSSPFSSFLEFNADLNSATALSAGDYLLSVWSATNFAWQRVSPGSGTSFRSTNSGATSNTSGAGDNAWNISNTFVGAGASVPEPSIVLLTALGLVAFGVRRNGRA